MLSASTPLTDPSQTLATCSPALLPFMVAAGGKKRKKKKKEK